MTFDFQVHIDDQSPEGHALESIMTRGRISPEEAVRQALRGFRPNRVNTSQRRKTQKAVPLSEDEIAKFDQLCPAFKALEDVPDEVWQRIEKGRMRTEGLPFRV